MARGVRWYLVGSVMLGALGCRSPAAAAAFLWPSASRGGTRPRRNASIPARSRKAPARSASRRSTAPACAARISRSRSRRWATARALGFSDECGRRGRSRTRPPQPRWPVTSRARRRLSPTSRLTIRAGRRAGYPTPSIATRAAPPRAVPQPRRSTRPLSTPTAARSAAAPRARRRTAYDFRKPYGVPPPRGAGRKRADRSRFAGLRPVAGALRAAADGEPRRAERMDAARAAERSPAAEALRRSFRSARARPRSDRSAGPVAVKPAATLACPIVSALDHWIAESVQPAAMHWFGQPVVEIKQISAYSCRGMNGDPNAHISEHAFGNALDIASFTLADGRKITVENGWHGAPEEQGFLRDVQGAACEQFTTVLAPGSNRYPLQSHPRRSDAAGSGRRACNPRAVPGEEVAARARAHYAAQARRARGHRLDLQTKARVREAASPERLFGGPLRPRPAARGAGRRRRGLKRPRHFVCVIAAGCDAGPDRAWSRPFRARSPRARMSPRYRCGRSGCPDKGWRAPQASCCAPCWPQLLRSPPSPGRRGR